MQIEMTVESADLRVGSANIRLVPVANQSGDAQQLFAPGMPGGQAITMTLTNKESFGIFMPGNTVKVTFEVSEEKAEDKPQQGATNPTAAPAPVPSPR